MAEILFLSHRIPYPPNKGDKIRSFHWLRDLAERHTVHLGTFVDDDADWPHCSVLDEMCETTCYRRLAPKRARLRSLAGLARGEPLGFGYYRDRAFKRYVDATLTDRPVDAVLAFSSTVAPYVAGHRGARRVLDFVDMDSDKWAQYARGDTRAPMRWVYAREAATLAAAEQTLAAEFDASVFVSRAEADLFTRGAPDVVDRVHAIGNGVDADYFDPGRVDRLAERGPADIVFTGAMDYGANVDAVAWFVAEVWPAVRATRPDARFFIVGARPTRPVQALADHAGVTVTGTVDDVRPYLASARVAVAPMRIARGIQNKVLEALAMARPVVVTPQAAGGLLAMDTSFASVADTAGRFADAVLARLADAEPASYDGARAFVLKHYGWSAQVAALESLLLPEKR